jgi:hypothetical protein
MYNFFDILNQYVEKVIKPNFKIDFAGISSYSRVDDSNQFTGKIALPSLFSEYKQTDYYYKGDCKKFIHFTSLNTFIKIIDSGHFLASQLTYHDDPLEFTYASNEMSSVVRKETLTYLKEFLFSLSMCVYEEGEDSFDIWRLYGDSGNGVGVVFSFYPNKDNWRNSFLSPVYYGNNNQVSERFKRFSEGHIIFMKEHPEFTLQGDFWREPGGQFFQYFLPGLGDSSIS